MEQYILQNKIYNSILEPVVTHLENSKYNAQPETFEILLSTVQDILDNIKKQSGKDIVVPAVNLFIDFDNEIRRTKSATPVEWRKYVTTLFNALSELDEHNIYNIKLVIDKIQLKLNSLTSSLDSNYLKTWFQEFCYDSNYLLSLLNKRAIESVSKNLSKQFLLYIIQLSTCLKVLFQVFTEEITNKIIITESRRFVKSRFIFIFDGIKKCLNDEKNIESTVGFIQWMDNALDLLAILNPNKKETRNTSNLKTAIDEVLCHAMSITQISSEDDSKKIKANIQSVLLEFKQLETEFGKEDVNLSLCNLFLDLVSDKLCLLERKVNTAVLNISLKSFASFHEPLKNLQFYCEENDASIVSRTESDIDDLIANFDSHVDSLVQIGLFSIACSTNVKIISKIRSYLASLESLESEIIPALTSLYMEPWKLTCLHVNILANHWYDEVNNLRNDVCFIIDPVAFGQVVKEDYKVQVENMQKTIEANEIISHKQIEILCNNVKVFILVIDASVKEMKLTAENEINIHIEKLKKVYKEVNAAKKYLSNDDKKYNQRILTRVLILSTMIDRVIKIFAKENIDSTVVENEVTGNNIEKKVDDMIHNLKLDEMEIRGLEILKDKSAFYRTPNKSKLKPFATPKNVNLSKYTDARKLGFSILRKQVFPNCQTTEEKNESMDLQITEILEELTNLADTLQT